MRTLLGNKGEARRDEVLKAAQAENPAITKFDLGNGIRTLVKRGDIKVAPDDRNLFLPSLNNAAPKATTDVTGAKARACRNLFSIHILVRM